MSDYRNFPQSSAGAGAGVGIDQGLRAYMLRVYNYMAGGLALTAGVAYATYNVAVGPEGLTSFGVALYRGPLLLVLMLVTVGMVFAMSFALERMSVAMAQLLFWAYAALNGVTFSAVGLSYTNSSITQVFLITAATFGAMSLYGYTTRRDLTGLGSFLFMGLIGLLIASIAGIFFQSSALQMALSVLGVLIFTGFTAYDTQAIKSMYYAGGSGLMEHAAIRGALRLYLDFINLFLSFLRLFGDRR